MTDKALNGGLLAALVVAVCAACLLGSTPMPAARVLAALLGSGEAGDHIVVWEIRLPRALVAMTVGLALGASGAALQGLLRNPLAEPGVLGVSACAALGGTVMLYYGVAALWSAALPLASVAGAVAATAFLTLVAVRARDMVGLILVGVGLSSLAAAVMALLLNLAPNPFSLADMVRWMLGSVANRSFADLGLALPFLLPGLVLLALARHALTALSLGEEAAAGLGVNMRHARLMVVGGAGLATGAAVSMAGAIGFVGIVAPHLVRPWVDHDPARTMLPGALLGGLILVLADVSVRLIPTYGELQLGVLASLVGAPAFIWIAAQRGRRDG